MDREPQAVSSPEPAQQPPAPKQPYEPPRLTDLGSVEALTEQIGTAAASSIGTAMPVPPAPCDRNLKEHFAAVDGEEILARLAGVPVQTWNYRGQDPAVRHIGPMAQDFAAAFAVGADDRHIHVIDASGVALAAIQALHRLAQEQAAELRALRAEVAELREGAAAAESWAADA